MSLWWKKKSTVATTPPQQMSQLFPPPPPSTFYFDETRLFKPIHDIIHENLALVDVDLRALETKKSEFFCDLAPNDSASGDVDEFMCTTFSRFAQTKIDKFSTFRPIAIVQIAPSANDDHIFTVNNLDHIITFNTNNNNDETNGVDFISSTLSLDDVLMPPVLSLDNNSAPLVQFAPRESTMMQLQSIVVSCEFSDNFSVDFSCLLDTIVDSSPPIDLSPQSMSISSSVCFDLLDVDTSHQQQQQHMQMSLMFDFAPMSCSLSLLPVMLCSSIESHIDATPFSALRSSLIVALPPKSLDMSRRALPAPALSFEERDLQSLEARSLPLLPVEPVTRIAPSFEMLLPPPPPLDDDWRVDTAEADVLRAAMLAMCRDVAARSNLLHGVTIDAVLCEPLLRFASIDVRLISATPSSASWMATLPPEQAVHIDRKYRPLSVAVQNAGAALSTLDSRARQIAARLSRVAVAAQLAHHSVARRAFGVAALQADCVSLCFERL
jgi:hypothetical protein